MANRVVQAKVADLRPWDDNPRTITDERLDSLKRSLEAEREMLDARPLIALTDGTVIAGNQRLRAAQELGWDKIPTVYVDLDRARAVEWALRDNQPYGETDDALTAGLLRELAAGGRDLDLTGYSSDAIDDLLRSFTPGPAKDPDAVPPLPAKAKSKRGEVYELGPHRLMCGDATDKAAVAALVGTCAPPALMVTDPPYGVGVDHTWRDGLRQPVGAARTGVVANDDRADWLDAYLLTDAPVAYVWHSALHANVVFGNLQDAGFDVRQQIIWVKDVHALGRAAYQWKHEPCWYAVRKGQTASWKGGRKQSTVWEAASPIMAYGGGQDDQRTPHPTQKPISIFETPLLNHTDGDDYVYDPFGGSGTTLIAAERLGRRALLMELDPAYCDVIRQRYEDYTRG